MQNFKSKVFSVIFCRVSREIRSISSKQIRNQYPSNLTCNHFFMRMRRHELCIFPPCIASRRAQPSAMHTLITRLSVCGHLLPPSFHVPVLSVLFPVLTFINSGRQVPTFLCLGSFWVARLLYLKRVNWRLGTSVWVPARRYLRMDVPSRWFGGSTSAETGWRVELWIAGWLTSGLITEMDLWTVRRKLKFLHRASPVFPLYQCWGEWSDIKTRKIKPQLHLPTSNYSNL